MQLNRISSLYLKDDVIIGEVSKSRCGSGRFELDTPENGELQVSGMDRGLCSVFLPVLDPPMWRYPPLDQGPFL